MDSIVFQDREKNAINTFYRYVHLEEYNVVSYKTKVILDFNHKVLPLHTTPPFKYYKFICAGYINGMGLQYSFTGKLDNILEQPYEILSEKQVGYLYTTRILFPGINNVFLKIKRVDISKSSAFGNILIQI